MALKILSTCPLHTISGYGKRETHTLKMIHGDAKASTRCCWNCLEDFWPCAGVLSAVNAIGTQLCDPINSGLTRWRMAVEIIIIDAAAKIGSDPMSNRFSLASVENEQDADGTAEPVSLDQILTREQGEGKFIFPVQLTTSRIGNLIRLIHLL